MNFHQEVNTSKTTKIKLIVIAACLCLGLIVTGFMTFPYLKGLLTNSTKEAKKIPVVGEISLGDPVLDNPAFIYVYTDLLLHWYEKLDEPLEFEGFPISSRIEYGYDGTDKLTAIMFGIEQQNLDDPNHPIIELLNKRYGENRVEDTVIHTLGESRIYQWNAKDVYAFAVFGLSYGYQDTTTIIIATHDYGSNYLAPYFGVSSFSDSSL